MSRYGETAFGFLVILGALGLLVMSNSVRDFSTSSVDAAFMPRIAAGLLLILGAVTIFGGWSAKAADKVGAEKKASVGRTGWIAVAASMLLMTAYVALLDPLGFVLASIAYIFLQILLLKKTAPTRYITFVLVAALVPVSAYVAFVYLFEVMVPAGVLG